MKRSHRPFSNLQPEGWRNLLFFVIVCFYSIVFFTSLLHGAIGGDYLAFWSVGKIADEEGYSEIYNLSELTKVQQNINFRSGDKLGEEIQSFSPTPVPFFSVFIFPFQLLSRISLEIGYKIWTVLNIGILIGYLLFFLCKATSGYETNIPDPKQLIPFLICYAVFFNIACGQVEVFVLICAGEFARQANNKKPFISGLWLAGLLLKPQLLILVIPIFIIMRYWQTLVGFFVSSIVILGTSILLSGLDGMRALFNLWTKYSAGIATSAPEIMINWRMVGVNLDQHLDISFGWVIVGLGIVLTMLAVFYLVKHIPPYGNPLWMMTILGVFSATLAITWHSHYHMAMVLIPFLIYALVHKLLPRKIIMSWVSVTPTVFLGIFLTEVFFFAISRINPTNIHMKVIAIR